MTKDQKIIKIPWGGGERPALWQSEVAITHSGDDHANRS